MAILQDVFSPQDVVAPINISLTYVYKNNGVTIPQHLEFPINPEELEQDTNSTSDCADVEGLGEVSIPKKPSLAKMSIKSFFWQKMNLTPSIAYVRWLKRWQNSKQPALLVVTRFDFSMWVSCENFKYKIKAGEEEDIYFELELREYKEYGAKTLTTAMLPSEKAKQVLEIVEAGAEAMLVTIPPPTRIMRTLKSIRGLEGGKYRCKRGESILTICRKFEKLDKDWKELYEYDNNNRKVIADVLTTDNVFPENTELNIPQPWLDGMEVVNV